MIQSIHIRRNTWVVTVALLSLAVIAALQANVAHAAVAIPRDTTQPPLPFADPANSASADASTSVLVGFDPTNQDEAITSALLMGAEFPRLAMSGGFCVVQVPPGTDVVEFVRDLTEQPGVQYAEPDGVVYATMIPDDPDFSLQWAATKIGAPAAWDVTRGSSVKVAVIDSGADLDHPDLIGRLDTANDWDFVNKDDVAQDDYGHGTHVSGIIAATTNNGIGVAGVANQCTILPVKVMGANGIGSTSAVAEGIRYAADEGASVINMSFGTPTGSDTLDAAVQYAVSRDCVVVAATGNDGLRAVLYPAADENVIGVGSTTSSDALSYFSNYGPGVDIAAPGSSIYSTTFDGGYGYKTGTSMAAPHVAGVAALIRSKNPSWSRSQVENQLLASALDLGAAGRDDDFGYGRVNASLTMGVYRFRNLRNGFYLWTANAAEKDSIVRTLQGTWLLEGLAYHVDTSTQGNVSPLWRFLNIRGGFYLYSSDPAERDTIINTLSSEWRLEGEAYRVSTTVGAPVWRFRNLDNGTYLYSADPHERDNIKATLGRTWVEEGVAYYLAP
ncbi:MAG: S8 family serine peptidase [Coriobacteriia bacterium]